MRSVDMIKTRDQIELADKYNKCEYDRLINTYSGISYAVDPQADGRDMAYVRILSIDKRINENAALATRDQMQKVFTAMWTIQKSFNIVISFDGSETGVFTGTHSKDMPLLISVLESSVSGIAFEYEDPHSRKIRYFRFEDVRIRNTGFMGMLAGNPVVREYNEQVQSFSPIDNVLVGSSGMPWMLCVCASPVGESEVEEQKSEYIDLLTRTSECVSAGFSTAAADVSMTMTTTKIYTGSEMYRMLLQSYCDVYEEAMQCGLWETSILCFSTNKQRTDLFGGMLAAQLKSGKDEIKRPLPLRYYPQREISGVMPSFQFPSARNASLMTSREMAAVCALPVRDTCGFRVTVRADFDVHRANKGNLVIGNIINGHHITAAQYRIDLNSLNRHGLIIGLTGGGKTNTVKSLLHFLDELKCPFLVIEPAKKEYYELYRMGMTDLQVYSVGSHDGNEFMINPFEIVRTADNRHVSLQSHIDTVFAAFKASFIMYTPMPYVLETAIYEIYRDYGWDVEAGENILGRWEFPTIEDLYYRIEPVVKQMGYDERMQNDLTGSLKARINSLRVGAKGRTLNTARSIPMEKLLGGKVVIELDDVGDEDAKAFVISLLLMQIQECRKVQDTTQLGLRHMLLIEEAHRLLKNVSSGNGENADPRGNAVEYFCNMLAELRSKGQGFLVIDQIPSKLAPDLVKNTNLKIIHRTVAGEDRELVGGAMNMDESQKNYLACLEQGTAAVYSEGDNHPKLVKLPYAGAYESDPRLKGLSRSQIIELSRRNCQKQSEDERFSNQVYSNVICRHCRGENCSKSWTNPSQNIRRILSADTAVQAVKELHSKNLAEAFVWMRDKFTETAVLSEHDGDEIRYCFMAEWFSHFQDKMDYSQFAKCTVYILDMLRKLTENERTGGKKHG